MIIDNTTSIAYSSLVSEAAARVKYVAKVPSDIDISQSVEPIHISKIAADAGKILIIYYICILIHISDKINIIHLHI